MQQAHAILNDARLSAQKARLVANQIRGLSVSKARDLLSFSPKKAAHFMKKLLDSAIANAANNKGLDIDTLFLTTVFVNEGARLKRVSPRAKGRSNRITKQSCHITIVLEAQKA